MQNRVFHSITLLLLVVFCCCFSACKDEPTRVPSLGESFAGPISLPIREDVSTTSKIVATLKHGDRVDILQTRRRFVKVRTVKGVEGWTDQRQLMTPEQMKELQTFSEQSATLPSQGSATAFGMLNMHSEPNRQAPSFYQIAEGASIEVIGHRVAPRVAPLTRAPISIKKEAPPKKKKKEKKEAAVPPPPPPPPLKLPPNWLELSRTRKVEAEEPKPKEAPPAEPVVPVKMEDWSLVRTKEGKAGWVLSRMLSMTIPDDVAQYAEGHRITSYFALGSVQDGDTEKKNWLWTTMSESAQPYEFDSFRVFIWALRRHRYETAYIMRNVKGYFPVEAKSGTSPSFALILANDEGKQFKYNFAFEVNRVRLVQKTAYDPNQQSAKSVGQQSATPQPEAKPGVADRIKNIFKSSK